MSFTAGRLVAVVVTCNRLDQLKCSLPRWLEAPPEVLSALLLVDNASTDGTADWLKGVTDPRLTVLRLAENRGGAGGFEAGMRAAARQFDPDWMVLSDDDARPDPGALAAFLAADPDPRWEGCAAAVRHPDGRICAINRPVKDPFRSLRVFLQTLRRGRAGFHLGDEAYAPKAPEQAVDGASFVGFFLSRKGLSRAGWPDPALFLYGDDALYTLGLSRAGGRIGFLPQVSFEHDFQSLEPGGRMRPLWRIYYYHRNLLMLYRLCAGWLFWPALLIVLPVWAGKIRHYPGERRIFARLMRHALHEGLRRDTTRSHLSVLRLAEAPGPAPAAQRLSRST
ncbi:glycosyltransferase [Falsigemmobacter faecalis]|uniref:Glycosyltransferase n=1 Tax=Falsigemmobacter faecalis TaxID=2488730 RepID=A0A3P3DBG7_9RHOB|nr:glycosyltransferase [Falsigemmobacter faecalis]RRH71164.1 glycosyltransferase [Falsigemmobacter faecalis]